jgi:hypothetical protein
MMSQDLVSVQLFFVRKLTEQSRQVADLREELASIKYSLEEAVANADDDASRDTVEIVSRFFAQEGRTMRKMAHAKALDIKAHLHADREEPSLFSYTADDIINGSFSKNMIRLCNLINRDAVNLVGPVKPLSERTLQARVVMFCSMLYTMTSGRLSSQNGETLPFLIDFSHYFHTEGASSSLVDFLSSIGVCSSDRSRRHAETILKKWKIGKYMEEEWRTGRMKNIVAFLADNVGKCQGWGSLHVPFMLAAMALVSDEDYEKFFEGVQRPPAKASDVVASNSFAPQDYLTIGSTLGKLANISNWWFISFRFFFMNVLSAIMYIFCYYFRFAVGEVGAWVLWIYVFICAEILVYTGLWKRMSFLFEPVVAEVEAGDAFDLATPADEEQVGMESEAAPASSSSSAPRKSARHGRNRDFSEVSAEVVARVLMDHLGLSADRPVIDFEIVEGICTQTSVLAAILPNFIDPYARKLTQLFGHLFAVDQEINDHIRTSKESEKVAGMIRSHCS